MILLDLPAPLAIIVQQIRHGGTQDLAISFEQFSDAVTKLQNAVARPKDEYIRDSVIQRFEFCIELAWKVSKKLMGTATTAPKEVIREMAQNGLVSDVEKWLLSIDMRNLSSHTYNEEVAEKVYNFAVAFLPDLRSLLEKLRAK